MPYDEGKRPNYIVKMYPGTKLYKVIKFKQGGEEYRIVSREEEDGNEPGGKLANNLIRARTMVFQYVLCNDWQYFATLTLDSSKYDRYDLKQFAKDLSQYIRDLRKEYGTKLIYLLIPEQHKDGAWHMHGLFGGIPDSAVTEFEPGRSKTLQKLKNLGYKNWPDYADKFGFVSLGRLRDKVGTAFYVTKYISKDMSARVDEYGAHLYYASQKLNKAENAAVYYQDEYYLDKYCVFDTEFCSVGMVIADDVDTRKTGTVAVEPDFYLPDRYTDFGESVGFTDLPDGNETADDIREEFRRHRYSLHKAEIERINGLDLFEHITYKQLDLLNR